MQVLTKSIRIIDYENNRVYSRTTPDTFDEYISELISHINNNDSVRDFKTRSLNTEVISCAKEICEGRSKSEIITNKTDTIANRLLAKEIEAQGRVARMNTNVQKGSLVQALLYDEDIDKFGFRLAIEYASMPPLVFTELSLSDGTKFEFCTRAEISEKWMKKLVEEDIPSIELAHTDEYGKLNAEACVEEIKKREFSYCWTSLYGIEPDDVN